VELTACSSRVYRKDRADSALIGAAAHFHVRQLKMNDVLVFKHSKRLIFASRIVIWCWFWLALIIIGMVPLFLFRSLWFIIPCVVFFPSALPYLIIAFSIRCQNCNKFVTVQPFKQPPYADENKIKGINGWSGIILNVLFNKKFSCMHCGQKYLIRL